MYVTVYSIYIFSVRFLSVCFGSRLCWANIGRSRRWKTNTRVPFWRRVPSLQAQGVFLTLRSRWSFVIPSLCVYSLTTCTVRRTRESSLLTSGSVKPYILFSRPRRSAITTSLWFVCVPIKTTPWSHSSKQRWFHLFFHFVNWQVGDDAMQTEAAHERYQTSQQGKTSKHKQGGIFWYF